MSSRNNPEMQYGKETSARLKQLLADGCQVLEAFVSANSTRVCFGDSSSTIHVFDITGTLSDRAVNTNIKYFPEEIFDIPQRSDLSRLNITFVTGETLELSPNMFGIIQTDKRVERIQVDRGGKTIFSSNYARQLGSNTTNRNIQLNEALPGDIITVEYVGHNKDVIMIEPSLSLVEFQKAVKENLYDKYGVECIDMHIKGRDQLMPTITIATSVYRKDLRLSIMELSALTGLCVGDDSFDSSPAVELGDPNQPKFYLNSGLEYVGQSPVRCDPDNTTNTTWLLENELKGHKLQAFDGEFGVGQIIKVGGRDLGVLVYDDKPNTVGTESIIDKNPLTAFKTILKNRSSFGIVPFAPDTNIRCLVKYGAQPSLFFFFENGEKDDSNIHLVLDKVLQVERVGSTGNFGCQFKVKDLVDGGFTRIKILRQERILYVFDVFKEQVLGRINNLGEELSFSGIEPQDRIVLDSGKGFQTIEYTICGDITKLECAQAVKEILGYTSSDLELGDLGTIRVLDIPYTLDTVAMPIHMSEVYMILGNIKNMDLSCQCTMNMEVESGYVNFAIPNNIGFIGMKEVKGINSTGMKVWVFEIGDTRFGISPRLITESVIMDKSNPFQRIWEKLVGYIIQT